MKTVRDLFDFNLLPLGKSDAQMMFELSNMTHCYNSDFYHKMYFGLLNDVVRLSYHESLSR